jgi:membrane protein YdbS with pleckstrin-like domain
MATEIYIVRLRIISALRWIVQLGFVRIIVMLVFITGFLKSLFDIKNSPSGAAAIILLNASIIYSLHFSRKDNFLLSSLQLNKKALYIFEYLFYSLPFLLLLALSDFYFLSFYIVILLGAIINIKSGRSFKINISSVKSIFPAYAFEWISGMRQNLIPVTIIYLMGCIFSFHIAGGILSIIILTLIFSSFYIENEPLLFVELYKLPARKLVNTKILQALKIFLTLISPLVILHLMFFYERWYFVGGVIFICSLIITASVLTKYAFYSEEISSSKMNYIINGVIVFSFVSAFYMTGPFLFPLPFIMLIYLYKKASQNVKNIRFIQM